MNICLAEMFKRLEVHLSGIGILMNRDWNEFVSKSHSEIS